MIWNLFFYMEYLLTILLSLNDLPDGFLFSLFLFRFFSIFRVVGIREMRF